MADSTPHELVFGSVQHWCKVFVDGQQLAEHAGGFTRFRVALPVGPARPVTIVVLVDNRDDPVRSPLHRHFYDWYHYGGIAGHGSVKRGVLRCVTRPSLWSPSRWSNSWLKPEPQQVLAAKAWRSSLMARGCTTRWSN